MDSSWHGKCGGAMWQSSTSSSTAAAQSSQLLHSQDSRNLMLNAGHNFYRHAMQESGSSTHKVMLEPSFPVNSNTSSFNLLAPTEGSPFISFLSGPPSLLQYDTRQLGNPKPFIPSNNVPDIGSSFVFGPPRIGASLAPSLLLSENHDICCLTVGVDTGPVVSSRMEASAGRSSNSCSRDVRQVASINGQSSELAKIVNREIYHGNEQVKGFSSLKAGPLTSPSSRQIGQLHMTASQSLHSLLEGNFFPRHQPSPITTDCPRVFCLYASGALLLSNTGLLGVLCSCHGLHMSISKFSEHSGLLDVNPGHAVHVDSGETIAQWRKIYFHKFGIRIPEDHCGWEWPEGFSAEAGLVKSNGSVPDMLRSVELSNVVGPPGAFLSSGQPWNNVVFTNNPNAGQKLVNEVLPIKTQGDAKDSGNFRFIGTSQSNVQPVAANQITEHSMLGCSPMSKLASGPDNGSQSSSAYFDSISKSKSAFISLTNMQKEMNPGKESDAFRFHNLRSGDIMDRATVSSNIELRLGQPSQQNQTLDSNVPAFCAHLISSKDCPLKSLVMEPLIHKTGSARVMDESRQYLKVDAHTAKSSTTREPRTINSVKQASEVYDARGTVQTVQVNDCSARGSAMSMFLSKVENPFNGKLQSNMSSNMVDASHVMPKQPLCESLSAKCDPISHPCMKGNIMGTKSSVIESRLLKQMERDKGAHTAFSTNVAHEVNFGCPMKSMGTLLSSCGFGDTSHDTCSGTSEKISHPHQLFAMAVDASDGRIPFNYLEKTSCLGRSGYYDHGFIRSVSSLRIGSGPTPPSQTISLGFSSITTTSMTRDGIVTRPCVVDEKSQMLAVREVMKYSNQDHVITSLGINQDQGGAYASFSNKVKSSIAIPSRSTNMRDGTSHGSKEDAPELSNKSTNSNVTCWMEGGCEKSSHVLGKLAASQEAPLSLGDYGMQCQLLCNPHPIQQPSIRLGGNDNHIGPSCEQGNSCQRMPHAYLPDKYIRVVQQNYLDRNCDLKSKTSLDALKEAAGSLSGRTSMDKGCTSPMDKATSVGQIGDLLKPNLNQVNCNTFQWKDVPCKATVMGKVTCKDRSTLLLDGRKSVEDQISDPDSRCCNRSSQGAECIKEQEPSCISSKCSAPAVTQTSVKVSIEDSCTDDAQDSRRANNHVVDKGSGIEKCWSSDDAPDSGRSTQFDCFYSKNNLIDEGSPEAFPDRSSRSLIDELRLRNSRVLKKVQKDIHTGLTTQKCEGNLKFGKRKRATKWKRLNASFYPPTKSSGNDENPNCTGRSEQKSYNLEGAHMLRQHSQGRSHNLGPTFKRRCSTSSSSLTIGCKGGMHRFCYNREGVIDCQTLSRACDSCIEIPEYSRGKRFRSNQVSSVTNQVLNQEAHCTEAEITMKCNSVSRGIVSSNKHVNVSKSNARPIVCGKYGIISNGNTSKAVKILSLGKILRNTRRCTHGENSTLKLSPAKSLKNTRRQESKWCTGRTSSFKAERDKRGQGVAKCSRLDLGSCVEVMEMTGSPCGENNDHVSYMMDKEKNSRCEKSRFMPTCGPYASLKSKSKEVRKRSLYEITAKGKDSSCASFSGMKHMDPSQTKCRSSEQSKSTADMDSFCCVCWNSNNDEVNCLLECSRCLIRVHQACYGISIVPKTHWYCRPCRTSSQNIVCVLCGYRGGAMTMALRSHNIVRSLLHAWNLVTEARPENSVYPCEAWEDWLNMEASSRSQFDSNSPSKTRPACINSSLIAVWKKDLRRELHTTKNSCFSSDTMVQNSITAGVVDPTVEQWVHMVCGLWTPGIRCPNVDTMSAFDVSGVSRPKANVVCSICNCPGGSCIRCRVVDCPIHFHPWCAHLKGLLQSEVEGADNEKVGFYGRCELHATQSQCSHDTDLGDTKSNPGEKELTCARTEGYNGRKREGVRHNNRRLSDGIGGCLVSQEQLNAWIHINTQKSYTKRLLKLPVSRGSDIETDCRKEYTRYKQLKGWKHLVVYKSGIHALGLYTSSFISRGAMVVEYVGEIVGLRVADRRENDYQSGKRLQYKSACYFFRIDKEHIIDATRKGGIARFVNHSCLPNCVAKVITVRNEKKVVFFAERDVFPGEEITYDYHFNHEDEGKKIPCLCNAKNCRRYLN